MRKILSLALVCVFIFSLAACTEGSGNENSSSAVTESSVSSETSASSAVEESSEISDTESSEISDLPTSVTITTYNGSKEEVDIEVTYDPERVAVMDLAVLDMLDTFGLGDRVVGVSKGSSIDYLQSYVTDDNLVNLGTIKEADLEAVMSCEPDVIFIGGRLSSMYDDLSEIAPVVYLATDTDIGLVESVRNNANTIASIFGVQELVDGQMAGFDERIEALKAVVDGKTAVVGMSTSGSFNVLGNDGRCSIIGVEVGFNNIGLEAAASSGGRGGSSDSNSSDGEDSGRGEGSGESSVSEESTATTATHGNEASFEILVELNPDYIFVMDRDAAIATEGAQLAQEIMENELVQKTDAYQNGNIVYLDNPAVWYTAEGGIHALDVMLTDLETALLN